MKKNKSIKEILFENGFIVTDDCFGGWDKKTRMIKNLKGEKIGFFTPLEALNKLVKTK